MIQCSDCEFFKRGESGEVGFGCDPFSNIKEPECLAKWQLVELRIVGRSHRATLDMYQRLAPLQEKLFKHLEREIDDVEEADRWKLQDDDCDDDDEISRL